MRKSQAVIERRRFTGRTAVAMATIGHVVLLAVLIGMTRFVLGFEGALTPTNQIIWSPLVLAQLYLLATYLGLGGGSAWVRLPMFSLGVLAASVATVSAHLLLATSPPSYWRYFAGNADLFLAIYMLPMLCVGAVLLPLRIFWGAIQRWGAMDRTSRFNLGNLLAFTTIVAVAASVFAGVQEWEVGLNINYQKMPLEIAAASLGLSGAAYFTLASGRARYLGLTGLICGVVAGWFIWPNVNWTDWIGPCYAYGAVLLTLLWLRRAGYRLRGGLEAGAAPERAGEGDHPIQSPAVLSETFFAGVKADPRVDSGDAWIPRIFIGGSVTTAQTRA